MINPTLQFQIEQLRTKNLQKTMEALFILVAALFVSALLPSLMVRYVYAGQQLMEEPRALQFIPVAAFIIGVGYSIYVIVTNLMREMKASRLEMEMLRTDGRPVTKSSTSDLQVALSRVESSHTRSSSAKTTRAKKSSARRK